LVDRVYIAELYSFRTPCFPKSHGIFNLLQALPIIFWAITPLTSLPCAKASAGMIPFPNISFDEFSQFIKDNFDSAISLASVLCMVFSLTENPELLALHARQQKGRFEGENSVAVTAWIKCLSQSIQNKLGNDGSLLKESNTTSPDAQITALGMRLDAMAKLLQLHPSNC